VPRERKLFEAQIKKIDQEAVHKLEDALLKVFRGCRVKNNLRIDYGGEKRDGGTKGKMYVTNNALRLIIYSGGRKKEISAVEG
jgi:hypothetical protein